MQAHYNVDGWSAQFKSVAKKYAQAAGKAAGLSWILRQAVPTMVQRLQRKANTPRWHTAIRICMRGDQGVKEGREQPVSGITVWGVIGAEFMAAFPVSVGASGSAQCPICFLTETIKQSLLIGLMWMQQKLQPAIQKVTITEAKDGNIAGETYTIDQGAVQAEFIPVWDARRSYRTGKSKRYNRK